MHEIDPNIGELLKLNQDLLDSIARGDWEAYFRLCDPTLSAFEPEARGHLVEGMDFHHFYFKLGGTPGEHNTTMVAPKVRMLGDDAAVVTCVRLVQRVGDDGKPFTLRFEETRVWERQDGVWRHVHFHRSANE